MVINSVFISIGFCKRFLKCLLCASWVKRWREILCLSKYVFYHFLFRGEIIIDNHDEVWGKFKREKGFRTINLKKTRFLLRPLNLIITAAIKIYSLWLSSYNGSRDTARWQTDGQQKFSNRIPLVTFGYGTLKRRMYHVIGTKKNNSKMLGKPTSLFRSNVLRSANFFRAKVYAPKCPFAQASFVKVSFVQVSFMLVCFAQEYWLWGKESSKEQCLKIFSATEFRLTNHTRYNETTNFSTNLFLVLTFYNTRDEVCKFNLTLKFETW